jgi:hypothetical protein
VPASCPIRPARPVLREVVAEAGRSLVVVQVLTSSHVFSGEFQCKLEV